MLDLRHRIDLGHRIGLTTSVPYQLAQRTRPIAQAVSALSLAPAPMSLSMRRDQVCSRATGLHVARARADRMIGRASRTIATQVIDAANTRAREGVHHDSMRRVLDGQSPRRPQGAVMGGDCGRSGAKCDQLERSRRPFESERCVAFVSRTFVRSSFEAWTDHFGAGNQTSDHEASPRSARCRRCARRLVPGHRGFDRLERG
jgi:hypothetical protein